MFWEKFIVRRTHNLNFEKIKKNHRIFVSLKSLVGFTTRDQKKKQKKKLEVKRSDRKRSGEWNWVLCIRGNSNSLCHRWRNSILIIFFFSLVRPCQQEIVWVIASTLLTLLFVGILFFFSPPNTPFTRIPTTIITIIITFPWIPSVHTSFQYIVTPSLADNFLCKIFFSTFFFFLVLPLVVWCCFVV